MAGNGVNLLLSAAGRRNTIRLNSIFNNGALGIDLGDNGPTANDSLPHTGPNNYQNFPKPSQLRQQAALERSPARFNVAPGDYILDSMQHDAGHVYRRRALFSSALQPVIRRVMAKGGMAWLMTRDGWVQAAPSPFTSPSYPTQRRQTIWRPQRPQLRPAILQSSRFASG